MKEHFEKIKEQFRQIQLGEARTKGDIWELKYNLRQLLDCLACVEPQERPGMAEASILKAEKLIERITKEYDL